MTARRRRVARRGLRVTREGRVFVLTTLGVGAAAVNTGNNLLFLVLGLMLGLILVSGVLSDLALMGLRVRRSLPTHATAGKPCVVELVLANDKPWISSLSIELEDQAEGQPNDRRCYFLKVGARAEQVGSYRRTPSRRGLLRFERVRATTRHPFGLFEKWRLLDVTDELLVHPAVVAAAAQATSASARSHEQPVARPGPGTELGALRELRQGDDARAIHARRSAALGRPVLRERERDAGARLTVLLDDERPAAADPSWDSALENAISRAAGHVERGLRGGATVDVRSRGRASPVVLGGAPPGPILRFLALLPAAEPSPMPTAFGATVLVRPEPARDEPGSEARAS